MKVTSPTGHLTHNATDQSQEVVLRRTQSFEADEKYVIIFNCVYSVFLMCIFK